MFFFTQVLQVSLTLGALARYCWMAEIGLGESVFVTCLTAGLVCATLKAQWTSHKTNPGFIIVDTENITNAEMVCKRCEAQRPDMRAHHCSKCKRCVLEMQHHCIFTDNCVGKTNLKHFLRYCAWMTFFLFWMLGYIIKAFYVQNRASGTGITSLTQLNPFFVLFEISQMVNPAFHVKKTMLAYSARGDDQFTKEMLIACDDTLFTVTLVFLLFVVYMLNRTLSNLMQNTSQPDKLKHITHGPPRSLTAVVAEVFGKQASLLSIINPFN